MRIVHPYHEGELFVQRRAGGAEMAQRNGGIIDDRIPRGALRFILSCPASIMSAQSDGARQGVALTADQSALIASADTLFVASAAPNHGVDASHRGGQPGFVCVLDDRRLRIPDYVGNSLFNTLGNFVAYPHAGLVFVDFDGSRALQLTGRAEILWNAVDPDSETGSTRRYWEFQIERWLETPFARQCHWKLLDYSPFNPKPRCGSSEESRR